MNSMKKLYTTLLLAAFLLTADYLNAAPMAVHNQTVDCYAVTTQYYRCTFYVGCMYPVWFRSADGKAEFPRGFLLDWVKKADAPDTELYYLRNDQYAEVKIIENSEKSLIVECTGKFCKDIYRFPGVTAYYRWTLKKNSPEILLEGELRFDENVPRQMVLTMLGSMAFNKQPFAQVKVGNAPWKNFRTANKAPESFVSPHGVMLKTANNLVMGVSGNACAWNNSFNRFYTYVSSNFQQNERLWNGQQPFKFTMKFNVDGSVRQ